MSRPANISDSLTFTPATWVSGSYFSISGQTTPVGQGSDGTNYAQVNLTRNANAVTEAIWSFDCSSIPVDATITSISCSCKCSINNTNTNRITTRQAQLYSGTTAKGSASTVANSTTAFNITCGTWTRAELQNARIRLYAVRGTNNATSNYYFRFYGATLTINYSLSGTEYEVSISNTSDSATTQPSTTQYVFQGGSQEIVFTGISSLDDVEITDNSNDIESQLVHSTSVSKTDNCIPASLSDSNGTVTDANNGLTDVTSDTYSQLLLRSGTYMEYSFDTSNIPSNATITSISCQVKGCVTRTSNAATAQLYSGSTAKGSTSYLSYNSNVTTINLTCGTWTISELQNARIRIVSTYTNTNTYYAQFYGATLTVSYTVAEDTYTYTISNISGDHAIVIADASATTPYFMKVNGEYRPVKKFFRKVDGEWVEIDISTLSVIGPFFYKGWQEEISYDVIGEVTRSSSETSIIINDNALSSGNYTLYYEDEGNNILSDVDEIANITIS